MRHYCIQHPFFKLTGLYAMCTFSPIYYNIAAYTFFYLYVQFPSIIPFCLRDLKKRQKKLWNSLEKVCYFLNRSHDPDMNIVLSNAEKCFIECAHLIFHCTGFALIMLVRSHFIPLTAFELKSPAEGGVGGCALMGSLTCSTNLLWSSCIFKY